MVRILKPAIERRYNAANKVASSRKRIAEAICHFLETNPGNANDKLLELGQFYDACEELLVERDSERILLYLPLELLQGAPESFKEAYRNAWYRLLDVRDVRENFHLGDCFELDARPSGGLERIAKCAHLTPWLLKYEYIDKSEVLEIMRNNHDDEVLLQSFRDTWKYIRTNRILADEDLCQLVSETTNLPERKKSEPLYISKKRLEWLDECNHPAELLTPSAKLEGPFSDNLPVLEPQIKSILPSLSSSEIILIGGSQLKGYATIDSDLDTWTLRQLMTDPLLYPGNPRAAHLYFNTIWLGGQDMADELESIADSITEIYTNSTEHNSHSKTRLQAIERLESDLLQYRLLHKGFSRFTGIDEFKVPPEMDGDCAFYIDEYRRIATMLYAKYVWL